MSARTVTEYRALAKTTNGLGHLAARRNTGTWVSRCGRQIRGQEILEWRGEQAGVQAVALGDQFCAECRAEAIRTAGTIADGVAILLSLDPADDSAPQLLDIPVTAIAVDGPLRDPGDDLIRSVAVNGVMSPVVLRRTSTGLRLVAGGRRLTAAIAAGQASIPAIVRDLDDQHSTVERLLENLHREDLDPIAQAHAYVDAINALGLASKAELGRRLGISREQISNTIRLLGLPAEDQQRIASGELTAEGGRALLRQTQSPVNVAPMPDVAALLAALLDAKVNVTARGERTRIVIDVADIDRARVLAQLGIAA